jgi:hypothetical protein
LQRYRSTDDLRTSRHKTSPHLQDDIPSQTQSEVGIFDRNTKYALPSRPRSVIEVRSRETSSSQILRQEGANPFDDESRNFTILRHFWHAWRARHLRRSSRLSTLYEMADRHYSMILLPITFGTWKQKWQYFAILQRRVDRDSRKRTLSRCVAWWRFTTVQSLSAAENLYVSLLMRRIFRIWHRKLRYRRAQMNVATMSTVIEHWKSKASSYRDLSQIAERWDRRHRLRRSWKEWFFRTCSVKTVQYYEMKLKQRSLARWIVQQRRLREVSRRVDFIYARKLLSFAIQRWNSSLSNILSQTAQASSHWKSRILIAALHIWQRNLQLSLRASLIQDKVGNQAMRFAFERWKMTTYCLFLAYLIHRKFATDAKKQANWRLLKLSFKAWRDDTVAARLEDIIGGRRLEKAFAFWKIQHRATLLSRVRDQRLAQEAFAVWRDRAEEISLDLGAKLQTAKASFAIRVARYAFDGWREKIALRDEKNQMAVVGPLVENANS